MKENDNLNTSIKQNNIDNYNNRIIQFVDDTLKDVSNLKNYPEFRKSPRHVLTLIESHAEAILYADESLQNDPLFMMRAVRVNPFVLYFANESIKNNRDVQLFGALNGYCCTPLQEDEEFVVEAAKRNMETIAIAPEKFRKDENFMLEMAKINPLALKYVAFQPDAWFLLAAYKITPETKNFFIPEFMYGGLATLPGYSENLQNEIKKLDEKYSKYKTFEMTQNDIETRKNPTLDEILDEYENKPKSR